MSKDTFGHLTKEYMQQVHAFRERFKQYLKKIGKSQVEAMSHNLCEVSHHPKKLQDLPRSNQKLIMHLALIQFYDIVAEIEKEIIESN